MTQELFSNEEQYTNGPVTVLGKTFANDEERRAYFREELRKKLPELKEIEGFPIGEDDDIINLSDPPFYTACPNPWINDFIAEWEEEKKQLEKEGKRIPDFEVTEPYAADVSEGKNNPIYMAHSYHTKVPHPAIMRYIMHYTQPGDVVFDGFAGTGMTGVAASMCANPDADIKAKIEKDNPNAKWGKRNAICNDLSPIASFISSGLNYPIDKKRYIDINKQKIDDLEKKYGYLYHIKHDNGIGNINYILWSQVICCNECGNEQNLWAPDNIIEYKISDEIVCNNCGIGGKTNFSKVFITYHDKILNKSLKKVKYKPVLVNYSYNKKKYYKILNNNNEEDELLPFNKLEIPIVKIDKGDKTSELLRDNYNYIHQLFTEKNLFLLQLLWQTFDNNRDKMIITSTLTKTSSILHNVGFKKGKINLAGALPNALYVPGIYAERNIFELHKTKIKDLSFDSIQNYQCNQIGSANSLKNIINNSIDYIFTDPPFGANLMYSELNIVHEGWLKIKTNNKEEAIVNKTQNKKITDYLVLMTQAFTEFYRILKPGKWMTVEFSNTKAEIWNVIQTSLIKSNFIVASVDSLDKVQGTFNAQTTATAVKQDLAITCYKPSSEFDTKFQESQHSPMGVWDFVEEHLSHLPIHLVKDNSTTAIIERSAKILFDRLIAFYVQRSLPVPIDAGKFQEGLKERFVERDGMYFTQEQVEEYERKKAEVPEFIQMSLFVGSEQDAVYWLRQLLEKEHRTESDLHPLWMREVAGNMRKGDTLPEMRQILEENFLKDDTGKWYVPDAENEADLEKLRNKRLLKIFEDYKVEAAKPKGKLKEVRVEALRVGFKQCYQDKDFKTIVNVGDRIPNNLLMEDEVLLQFYDIASAKI